MSYSLSERARAGKDFREAFGISIQSFYDGFVSMIFKGVKIDIVKFDDYLIEKHGDYIDEKKSMQDIVIEKYGEEALKILEKLV